MQRHLRALNIIDWHRNANQWQLRVINNNSCDITNTRAVTMIASYVKQQTEITLSKEEILSESSLKNAGIKYE